ncbi:CPBP family intramembrane glutamic endopeptidase [Spirochaeta lutea]|uniref:CAAX prenyl protease 2/Lysostaphin resistance protein A-like domain-containing protein n=1 Tax=Spirochaeta lutea TaxID=1480694 RepID=A0A098R2A4_9SPIO|nr:CPBP family intramembrane glutamic endopeptidase [Spirochaeta lutea]KGE73901.1 hypothetical protein DC28_01490 [Spirochaeta lutea]
MHLILEYVMVLIPGLVLGGVLLWGLKRNSPLWHLGIFIMVFIFTRDAMTPLGLWRIGSQGGIWLRFYPDPLVLAFLGASGVVLVLLFQVASPALAETVVWFRRRWWTGLLVGLAGALVVAAPLLIYQGLAIPLDERGGMVPRGMIPFLLMVTLGGNFLEEVLFRGYVFGWLTTREEVAPGKAAVLSGVLFSFGHLFLAFTVTDLGIGLLVFTLWEGCLAGVVRWHYGVIPAVVTHGLAIFLLAAGVV